MARKMSNYCGNIASILQSDIATDHQRKDNCKRARCIARAVGKSGNLPAIPDLQTRYHLNETEPKKLLATGKRYLHKLQKDAKALGAARAERHAVLAPVAPSSPEQPATPPHPSPWCPLLPSLNSIGFWRASGTSMATKSGSVVSKRRYRKALCIL